MKVKINIRKIDKKIETASDLMKEILNLRGPIQVSIRPNSDKEHVIVGGQKDAVEEFKKKLTEAVLLIDSEVLSNPSKITASDSVWWY